MVKKIVEGFIVIVSLIVAFFVYKGINPEQFIKPDDTPVMLGEIDITSQTCYTGKAAGSDIPRLTSSEELEELVGTSYVTAQTSEVISTGVYGIKPWVDPYEITKVRNAKGRMVSSGRRAPDATDNAVQAVEYYQEYYLIKLPDESYILAQFGDTYREKIENGENITLPIGLRKANTDTARKYLKGICDSYQADNTYTLYMIDDEWQEEHEFTFMLMKFGIAAVVFIVLAVGALTIFYKVSD
ncbi:MAG: hypothetical protein IJN02_01340 [Bacteroidales bacterium]|nr:hypothetical protein [Bacteroidales bacterium]